MKYLSCCYKVLQGVDGQAEDVVIVAHVETLGVLLSVVHDADSSDVVNDLTRLSVEQIAPAVVAPVAAHKDTREAPLGSIPCVSQHRT